MDAGCCLIPSRPIWSARWWTTIFIRDVFRYDRLSAQVMLVSHAAGSTGQVANEASTGHAISNDGARVLLASSLMAGVTDANAAQDVFLRDLPLGATSLVSHSSSVSVAANGLSAPAGMSANAQVLFTSEADDVAGMTLDGNGAEPDLFRFESATGVVRLVGHQAAMPTVSPGAGAARDGRQRTLGDLSNPGGECAHPALQTKTTATRCIPQGHDHRGYALARARRTNGYADRQP